MAPSALGSFILITRVAAAMISDWSVWYSPLWPSSAGCSSALTEIWSFSSIRGSEK